MSEHDWLSMTDSVAMVEYLRPQGVSIESWSELSTPYAVSSKLDNDSNLVRELYGNPFRPVQINPSWLTADVLAIAKEIRDGVECKRCDSGEIMDWVSCPNCNGTGRIHDFGQMPILADALQDAGCDSEDLIWHLRGWQRCHRGCINDDKLGRIYPVNKELGQKDWLECDCENGWTKLPVLPNGQLHLTECWALKLLKRVENDK